MTTRAPRPTRPQTREIVNWGGNVRFRPGRLARPVDPSEIGLLVARAAAAGERVRVVGSRHSWAPQIETDGLLLDLGALRACTLDDDADAVIVEGGVRLRDLNAFLASAGLALENLGYVSEQTVAGAVVTGTHGSGRGALLATAVEALTLVTADGAARSLSAGADPELFAVTRLGLGATGVVADLRLRCRPAFDLRETRTRLPFEEAFGPELAARLQRYPYAHYVWFPHVAEAVFVAREILDAPGAPSPAGPPRAGAREWLETHVGACLGGRLPRLVPALNRLGARSTLYREGSRTGRSDALLNGPLPPVYRETEYALPLERASEAMAGLRAVVERERLALNFPVTVRFAAADDIPLSPACGRDVAFISVAGSPGAPFEAARRAIEPGWKALGGRPHWAKLFDATADELARLYPDAYERVRATMSRVDPGGTFRNPFLDRLFPRG